MTRLSHSQSRSRDPRPHRYTVGQRVRFSADRFEMQADNGTVIITQLLPSDGSGWLYRVRDGDPGRERVVRESQLDSLS